MELIFLGTSAGVPTRSRNVTAILLDLKHPTRGGLWLFDCGEGTQHQLLHTSYHPGKVDKIFITHLHGDHLFGLPGLLCSRSMAGNMNALTIYGPAGIGEFVETTLRLSGLVPGATHRVRRSFTLHNPVWTDAAVIPGVAGPLDWSEPWSNGWDRVYYQVLRD